jgi:hypothetical protein
MRGSNSTLGNVAQRETSSFSFSSITIIKLKGMIWAGYVARFETKCVQSPEKKDSRKDHWEDLGVDQRIISNWILKK